LNALPKSVRAELVEAPLLLLARRSKEKLSFDKLRTNGKEAG